MSYPDAIDPDQVGEYPAQTKSGGGHFYDQVLEYRVWCRPAWGSPDLYDGDAYYHAFATYAQALDCAKTTPGAEDPLVLVRQLEWIDEPVPQQYRQEKGERLTEWRVEWLLDSKRTERSIAELLAGNGAPRTSIEDDPYYPL